MREIALWLSEPPRGVSVSRQAVHAWIQARIRKLVKLNEAFRGTGVVAQFRTNAQNHSPSDHDVSSVLEPSDIRPSIPPPQRRLKKVDVSEFMTDDSDIQRALNPLLVKGK